MSLYYIRSKIYASTWYWVEAEGAWSCDWTKSTVYSQRARLMTSKPACGEWRIAPSPRTERDALIEAQTEEETYGRVITDGY